MESRAAARPFKSDGDDRRRPATSAIRRGATARRTFCRRWLAFERTSAYNAITLALTVVRPTGLAAKYITTTPSCVHAHAFPPCRANGRARLFSFLASRLFYRSIIRTKCEIALCEKIAGRFIYLSFLDDTLTWNVDSHFTHNFCNFLKIE